MSIGKLISKLEMKYKDAECLDFFFSSIDSALAIHISGTDVHSSLREKVSHKDQIDLTYGATLPLGRSPVDDFFPTILRPQHLPQSRHLKIPCRVWGECLDGEEKKWMADEIDVVRISRNKDANPGLQLRGVNELRKKISEGNWLIFVHQRGYPSYEAFSLSGVDWENPSGPYSKKEVLFVEKDSRVDFRLGEISEKEVEGAVPCVASNTIYYGPPGTGKSTVIKQKILSAPMFRTQFHPEYSHADFIGSYRPVVGSETGRANQVIGHDGTPILRPVNYFAFVPGPLALALECAFGTNTHVFLVIEEINRGDCAAIFGDAFQLLDRDDAGRSEFGITLKPELLAYFVVKGVNYDIAEDGKLYLPPNLSLLATMNTSDQSLYPMDSAFKRRWQWNSCPIDFSQLLKYTDNVQPFLDDGKNKWDWIHLVEAMNKNIAQDRMEDKQLGPWFIKPEKGGEIPWEAFLNKCLFYLWHDVFKEEQLSDLSPFKNDGPEVFGEVQVKIREKGLDAGFKKELLSPIPSTTGAVPVPSSNPPGAAEQVSEDLR